MPNSVTQLLQSRSILVSGFSNHFSPRSPSLLSWQIIRETTASSIKDDSSRPFFLQKALYFVIVFVSRDLRSESFNPSREIRCSFDAERFARAVSLFFVFCLISSIYNANAVAGFSGASGMGGINPCFFQFSKVAGTIPSVEQIFFLEKSLSVIIHPYTWKKSSGQARR